MPRKITTFASLCRPKKNMLVFFIIVFYPKERETEEEKHSKGWSLAIYFRRRRASIFFLPPSPKQFPKCTFPFFFFFLLIRCKRLWIYKSTRDQTLLLLESQSFCLLKKKGEILWCKSSNGDRYKTSLRIRRSNFPFLFFDISTILAIYYVRYDLSSLSSSFDFLFFISGIASSIYSLSLWTTPSGASRRRDYTPYFPLFSLYYYRLSLI